MSSMKTAIEKAIQKLLCMKIETLIAKNKNNPIMIEILTEVLKSAGCGAEEQ